MCSLALAGAVAPRSAFASPPGGPPSDPNEAPRMPAPHGQLGGGQGARPDEGVTRPFSPRRRAALTVAPTFAALRSPLLARPERSFPGGGVTLEADLRVARWLWVRAVGSYTAHPVARRQRVIDEAEGPVTVANAGHVQAGAAGLSAVYPLDLGRFLTQIDLGLGLMWLRGPAGASFGQFGAPCLPGGVCDVGLRCGVAATCEPAPVPELHIGLGVDYLIGRRWSAGAHVRYFALLGALDDLNAGFPFYLQLAARAALRF